MDGSNSKVVIILLASDGVRLQHHQLLRSDASLQYRVKKTRTCGDGDDAVSSSKSGWKPDTGQRICRWMQRFDFDATRFCKLPKSTRSSASFNNYWSWKRDLSLSFPANHLRHARHQRQNHLHSMFHSTIGGQWNPGYRLAVSETALEASFRPSSYSNRRRSRYLNWNGSFSSSRRLRVKSGRRLRTNGNAEQIWMARQRSGAWWNNGYRSSCTHRHWIVSVGPADRREETFVWNRELRDQIPTARPVSGWETGRPNPRRRNAKAGPRIWSSDHMARRGAGPDQWSSDGWRSIQESSTQIQTGSAIWSWLLCRDEENYRRRLRSRLAGPAADEARYFLAHHGVYKGPKLKVVFDAAAPFKGKCLNDAILSGPALQPSLSAILIQFREGEVAWASDVEAMVSRFRLRPADANFFCFLWKEPVSPDYIVCRMDRLTF